MIRLIEARSKTHATTKFVVVAVGNGELIKIDYEF